MVPRVVIEPLHPEFSWSSAPCAEAVRAQRFVCLDASVSCIFAESVWQYVYPTEMNRKKLEKKCYLRLVVFFLVWGCSLLNLKDVFVCVGSCSFYPEACTGRGSNWGAAKNTTVPLSPTNAIKQQSTMKITNSATEKWTHTHTHMHVHTHKQNKQNT
jgi:hypothetical protein